MQLRELREEVLVGYTEETFVTYKGIRIFYKYKQQSNQWLIVIYTGCTQRLFSDCQSRYLAKSKEAGIKWAITKIDKFLATHTG